MTIPGLVVINLLVGASVAFAARIQIRTLQRPLFTNRYFTSLAMLEGMIFVPIGIYFYSFYPDWSWMYLVDTAALPAGLGIMTQAAYPLAAVMGYLVGYFSARGGSDWVTLMFMGFVGVGFILLLFMAKDKLLWVGTFEQYHRNVGLNRFTATSLFPSLILAWLGAAACWSYVGYRFMQEGRISLRET